MQAQAQLNVWDADGIPTVPVTRQPCIIVEDGAASADARTIQRTAATQALAPLRATGSPKIVVCLADFTDVKFTVAKDAESLKSLFDTFFNGKGVGAGDNPYSVADYFRGMSEGAFSPEFVIMNPVTLSRVRSYYGESSGSGRRATFRNEALTLLASQLAGRVGELDTDGDGRIDGVIIVFPGCGANVGDEDGMHPSCWTNALTQSGITYATELIAPELLGMDNNAKLNGIGVFVHEISHMLGLPDFYDLNYRAPGMDYWSLMDYGEYWRDGYYPTPYTAYERHFMGWMPLVELSEPVYVSSMKSLGEGGSAYIVYNDGNRNEYYILENRTVNDPWSRSLCSSLGSGLMIYHVDYAADRWSANEINTDIDRQRMTIVPANGHFELSDNIATDAAKYISELRGHLWPLKNISSVIAYWGIAGNNALTDEERTDGDRIAPAARLHTPNTDGTYLMHKPIADIAFDDDAKTVSFSFMGGKPTGIDDVAEGDGNVSGDVRMNVYTVDGRRIGGLRECDLYTLPTGIYVLRNPVTGKTCKRVVGRQ